MKSKVLISVLSIVPQSITAWDDTVGQSILDSPNQAEICELLRCGPSFTKVIRLFSDIVFEPCWCACHKSDGLIDQEKRWDVGRMHWLPFDYSGLKELLFSDGQRIVGLANPKPKPLEVLIIGSTLVEFLSGIIQESAGDKYDLKITADACAGRIMGSSRDWDYDLFLLILDNIVFPTGALLVKPPINEAFRLLIHLKVKYKKPVIALYAWPKHPSYGRQAKLSGADFALEIPCPSSQLREAVRQCLDSLAERV
jgi:hypothetical protein